MLKGVYVGVGILLLGACATHDGAGTPSVEGRWVSAAPEPVPAAGGDTNYLVREFTITPSQWTIDFTLYDDVARTRPLLTGRNSGAYRVLAQRAANGASFAEFAFASRTLTPRAEAIAAALNAAGCGDGSWRVGAAQDVGIAGCAAFRVFPRAECEREHDLVRRDGARLFLGARPADGNLCTADRRPSSLGAALAKGD